MDDDNYLDMLASIRDVMLTYIRKQYGEAEYHRWLMETVSMPLAVVDMVTWYLERNDEERHEPE